MKNQWDEIWRAAVPFLQQGRPGDLLHTAIAIQNMAEIMAGEGVDDDILMPTLILHDIGWSACPRELVRSFFSNVKGADTNRQLRIRHMDAGAELSRELLSPLGYDAGQVDQVAAIIKKHDVADAMTAPLDVLVFDADYSWRFSQAGFYLDLERFSDDPDFSVDKAIHRLEGALTNLKTPTGRRIAEREFKARRVELGMC